MLTDVATLPMDLPVMAAPASRETTAIEHQSPSAETTTSLVVVGAASIAIDDRFGLDISALSARYADEVADGRSRLASGQQQTAYPSVLTTEGGIYTAFTAIPIVIAALDLARASNTPVSVTVMLCQAVDGEALLREMFAKARERSLFEKARYIAGCEAKYGTRRAWMRAEGISATQWEPRFSKIAKIGKLDDWLLSKIDPHSISNAEVASRIVDAWGDPAKRRIIIDVTDAAAAAATGPINAGPLFKRIDAALHPTDPPFTVGAWSDGQRDLLGADGTCIARLKRDDEGWSIGGKEIGSLTRATLTAALNALKN